MSIRIRTVDGVLVALCAARSMPKDGDVYLDDAQHHALSDKFAEDFGSEGHDTRSLYPEQAAIRAREESNNQNRTWWDSAYGSVKALNLTSPRDPGSTIADAPDS